MSCVDARPPENGEATSVPCVLACTIYVGCTVYLLLALEFGLAWSGIPLPHFHSKEQSLNSASCPHPNGIINMTSMHVIRAGLLVLAVALTPTYLLFVREFPLQAQNCAPKKDLIGEEHYDCVSAFGSLCVMFFPPDIFVEHVGCV